LAKHHNLPQTFHPHSTFSPLSIVAALHLQGDGLLVLDSLHVLLILQKDCSHSFLFSGETRVWRYLEPAPDLSKMHKSSSFAVRSRLGVRIITFTVELAGLESLEEEIMLF
jgi:hypothetical protein